MVYMANEIFNCRTRHQLNHNPKELYRCAVSDCNRVFVRFDLFNRHTTRHASENSRQWSESTMTSSNDSQVLTFIHLPIPKRPLFNKGF